MFLSIGWILTNLLCAQFEFKTEQSFFLLTPVPPQLVHVLVFFPPATSRVLLIRKHLMSLLRIAGIGLNGNQDSIWEPEDEVENRCLNLNSPHTSLAANEVPC